MIDCICDEKIAEQKLRQHVKESHEMDAIQSFVKAHFINPDPNVPDSWECMKCKHSKNKETILVSENTGVEHIKNEHLGDAIKEFESSLKPFVA